MWISLQYHGNGTEWVILSRQHAIAIFAKRDIVLSILSIVAY